MPETIKKTEFLMKYRVLVVDLDTRAYLVDGTWILNNKLAVLYTATFFARRFAYPHCVNFYIFALSVGFTTTLILLKLMYYIIIRPFQEAARNNLEIFNEIILAIFIYQLPLYTEMIPEVSDRFKLGWFFVALIILLVVVNSAEICRKVIPLIIVKCRKKY